jgi:translation elongation factor EF-Tu-like GTPase
LAGRPPGSRNRATIAAEFLLEGEAEALTRKAIEFALAGDTTALKLCLDRILPQRKSRAVAFELPRIERVEDLAGAVRSVLQQVARGRLLLDEGATLVGMMESKRRAMETIELEKRLRALEAERAGPGALGGIQARRRKRL